MTNQNSNNMKKLIILFLALFAIQFSWAQGSAGDIRGQVFNDSLSTEPILFARVWVERGASQFVAKTNDKGYFIIHSVPTGLYELNIYNAGDTLDHEVLVRVTTDGIARLGRINLHDNEHLKAFKKGVSVVAFKEPLIHSVFGETNISSLDIKMSPEKNDIKNLIQSRTSEISVTPSGKMVIRGGRAGDLVSYIDGVKLREIKQIPSSAIGGVTIFTSAIPARYGDTTGGVIVMETKSYYDLWRQWKIMHSKN